MLLVCQAAMRAKGNTQPNVNESVAAPTIDTNNNFDAESIFEISRPHHALLN
jgi:hypothetical protein